MALSGLSWRISTKSIRICKFQELTTFQAARMADIRQARHPFHSWSQVHPGRLESTKLGSKKTRKLKIIKKNGSAQNVCKVWIRRKKLLTFFAAIQAFSMGWKHAECDVCSSCFPLWTNRQPLAHQGKYQKIEDFFAFFRPTQKIGPDEPKWGQEDFFPTNPDLANILGDMDFDFDNFYFLDFFDLKFPDFQFPDFQISRNLAWAQLGHGLGPGLGPMLP